MTGAATDAPTGPTLSAWEDPPRTRPAATAPILAVDGFEGPLDWLLEMARAQKLDLARLSIVALVEAFADAMATALAREPGVAAPDLTRWAAWTVMAAQLTELRSRLLLPAAAPAARDDAEALRRQWVLRAAMTAAATWLERRPHLGVDVFARGQSGSRFHRLLPIAAPDLPGGDGIGDGAASGAEPSAAGIGDEARSRAATSPICCAPAWWRSACRRTPGAYRPLRPPFWRVSDAAARITRLLPGLPEGSDLGAFLPKVAEAGASRVLHCRAAVAATLIASLELTRDGALDLHQDAPWEPIRVHHRI